MTFLWRLLLLLISLSGCERVQTLSNEPSVDVPRHCSHLSFEDNVCLDNIELLKCLITDALSAPNNSSLSSCTRWASATSLCDVFEDAFSIHCCQAAASGCPNSRSPAFGTFGEAIRENITNEQQDLLQQMTTTSPPSVSPQSILNNASLLQGSQKHMTADRRLEFELGGQMETLESVDELFVVSSPPRLHDDDIDGHGVIVVSESSSSSDDPVNEIRFSEQPASAHSPEPICMYVELLMQMGLDMFQKYASFTPPTSANAELGHHSQAYPTSDVASPVRRLSEDVAGAHENFAGTTEHFANTTEHIAGTIDVSAAEFNDGAAVSSSTFTPNFPSLFLNDSIALGAEHHNEAKSFHDAAGLQNSDLFARASPNISEVSIQQQHTIRHDQISWIPLSGDALYSVSGQFLQSLPTNQSGNQVEFIEAIAGAISAWASHASACAECWAENIEPILEGIFVDASQMEALGSSLPLVVTVVEGNRTVNVTVVDAEGKVEPQGLVDVQLLLADPIVTTLRKAATALRDGGGYSIDLPRLEVWGEIFLGVGLSLSTTVVNVDSLLGLSGMLAPVFMEIIQTKPLELLDFLAILNEEIYHCGIAERMSASTGTFMAGASTNTSFPNSEVVSETSEESGEGGEELSVVRGSSASFAGFECADRPERFTNSVIEQYLPTVTCSAMLELSGCDASDFLISTDLLTEACRETWWRECRTSLSNLVICDLLSTSDKMDIFEDSQSNFYSHPHSNSTLTTNEIHVNIRPSTPSTKKSRGAARYAPAQSNPYYYGAQQPTIASRGAKAAAVFVLLRMFAGF